MFLAAGKTYDVKINVPAAGGKALPVYDRELSLSGNAIARDAGMLAYIGANGAGLPPSPSFTLGRGRRHLQRRGGGSTLTISRSRQGRDRQRHQCLWRNASPQAAHGTVALNWKRKPRSPTPGATGAPDTFTYCANGTVRVDLLVRQNSYGWDPRRVEHREQQHHHLLLPARLTPPNTCPFSSGRPGELRGHGNSRSPVTTLRRLQR